jgi:hypothetical protein
MIDDGTGKPVEEKVIELPKLVTTSELKDKKNQKSCCFIY